MFAGALARAMKVRPSVLGVEPQMLPTEILPSQPRQLQPTTQRRVLSATSSVNEKPTAIKSRRSNTSNKFTVLASNSEDCEMEEDPIQDPCKMLNGYSGVVVHYNNFAAVQISTEHPQHRRARGGNVTVRGTWHLLCALSHIHGP